MEVIPSHYSYTYLLNRQSQTNLISRIKFLPKNIGNLEMLKEAWLNDNELRELPDSLFELKSLKTLWLSSKF